MCMHDLHRSVCLLQWGIQSKNWPSWPLTSWKEALEHILSTGAARKLPVLPTPQGKTRQKLKLLFVLWGLPLRGKRSSQTQTASCAVMLYDVTARNRHGWGGRRTTLCAVVLWQAVLPTWGTASSPTLWGDTLLCWQPYISPVCTVCVCAQLSYEEEERRGRNQSMQDFSVSVSSQHRSWHDVTWCSWISSLGIHIGPSLLTVGCNTIML